MTDVLEELAMIAKSNLLSATEKANDRVRQIASLNLTKAGDLLSPLEGEEPFDLIYESVHGLLLVSIGASALTLDRNLRNIPFLHASLDLHDGQTSSTYVGDRSANRVPTPISRAL